MLLRRQLAEEVLPQPGEVVPQPGEVLNKAEEVRLLAEEVCPRPGEVLLLLAAEVLLLLVEVLLGMAEELLGLAEELLQVVVLVPVINDLTFQPTKHRRCGRARVRNSVLSKKYKHWGLGRSYYVCVLWRLREIVGRIVTRLW